jgi:hypothetical protein
VALHGLKTLNVRKFYALEPIPLLGNGHVTYAMKKRFPINIILLPLAITIRIANAVLMLARVGANNVFMVAQKK